jgi:two-component system, LytTR family, response regulator
MIRTIIVDDELLARENLKLLLSDFCENVEVVGEADSVDAAIDAITELKPTLVFLDIRMPSGIEGFELLERIDTKDFVVIFVTAFKDYAIKAFNANAIHYILKPIDVEDLQNALKKVTEYFKMKKSLPLKDFNYSELLENLTLSLKNDCPDRIAIHHCTHIYFKNSSSYLDTRTLKTYEDLLPFYFVRIHKSHIVNINSVEEYVHTDGHRVILNDKSTAPISRGKLSEFLTLLKRM